MKEMKSGLFMVCTWSEKDSNGILIDNGLYLNEQFQYIYRGLRGQIERITPDEVDVIMEEYSPEYQCTVRCAFGMVSMVDDQITG